MRKWILYFALLTSPFLLMVVVNQATKTNAYRVNLFGTTVDALNPGNQMESQCTWDCHTNGCSHHNNNVISRWPVDTLRRMIIDSLGVSNGDTYQTNNVLFLVILWPVLMFGLVVANVELFIRNRKKNA
jgi:hypothetical protein